MAKRSRQKARSTSSTATEEGAVGPRQPCPCGSGRRYKACHGDPRGTAATYVARPFEGLPSEADVIALREFVPAATAPLPLIEGDREVRLCTLLPGAAPALVRDDGSVWLGLQVQHNYGDPARDLGAVLTAALAAAEAGETGAVGLPTDPGPGPRLQDLVAADPLTVTVHEGFGFWLDDDTERSADVEAALEQANTAATPTDKLTSVASAYWTNVGTKEHLRWVMTEPEADLLDALARLHAAGADRLIPEGRFVGMFRAHGLLTPVWDLPVGTGAEALEEPAETFLSSLQEALAASAALTSDERSARAGLANRQVTIR